MDRRVYENVCHTCTRANAGKLHIRRVYAYYIISISHYSAITKLCLFSGFVGGFNIHTLNVIVYEKYNFNLVIIFHVEGPLSFL